MPRFPALLLLLLFAALCAPAAEEPIPDEINPLLAPLPEDVPGEAPPPAKGFSALWTDASLSLGATYYGRARSADNWGRPAPKDKDEIHVNAFGERIDFRSGYAWDAIGFDVSGQTNLGRGNGWSEVLLHQEPGNQDRSSASLGQAALKTRFGSREFGFEARGGYTPISIGSLGTSGGLFSHAYRGVETRLFVRGVQIGYGWADQFRNEWDNTFRGMTTTWNQNRYGIYPPGRPIPYVHSAGLRYEFGKDRAGFVDLGAGEGRHFRRNLQGAVSVPIDLDSRGVLTLTGYGIVARYQRERSGIRNPETEYHLSGSAQLKSGDWTFMAGLGHTRAPDSGEMQFRLTAWGNSDNRNFIQTWGQLDDFVWDGQNVVKAGVKYAIGNKLRLPGLSLGASYNFGWNAHNTNRPGKSAGWEIDYFAEYAVPEGRLKGLAFGVYAAHLRYGDNNFSGKQNRNDVKVILSYSRTLENFLRRR